MARSVPSLSLIFRITVASASEASRTYIEAIRYVSNPPILVMVAYAPSRAAEFAGFNWRELVPRRGVVVTLVAGAPSCVILVVEF